MHTTALDPIDDTHHLVLGKAHYLLLQGTGQNDRQNLKMFNLTLKGLHNREKSHILDITKTSN